jgi:hypothetical protein
MGRASGEEEIAVLGVLVVRPAAQRYRITHTAPPDGDANSILLCTERCTEQGRDREGCWRGHRRKPSWVKVWERPKQLPLCRWKRSAQPCRASHA